MAARTLVVGAALMIGIESLGSGCGLLGFGGEGDDDSRTGPAAAAEEEPAAADDSKGKAPVRFEDRLFLTGQTAELAGLSLTVEEIKECRYDKGTTQESLERQGKKLIAARVEFEGTSEQPVNASLEFRGYDSDRVVFRTASLSGTDCHPKLTHARLRASEKSKGWVGFRVPKEVQGLTMRYEHRPPKKNGAKGAPSKQYPEFSLST